MAAGDTAGDTADAGQAAAPDAFAGLPGAPQGLFSAASSLAPDALGLDGLAGAGEQAAFNVPAQTTASAPDQALNLFALGEFVPTSASLSETDGTGTQIVAPTAAVGGNVAFVNVTADGTGGYTVASGAFPKGTTGFVSSNASSAPLPKGAHGGDTLGESFRDRSQPSSGSQVLGYNFHPSSANSHQTQFSIAKLDSALPAGEQTFSLSTPLVFHDVKVLGWNSDSVLLSFASSVGLNSNDSTLPGGDIVISTEDMAQHQGSLPDNTVFTTTGAAPVINGTKVPVEAPCFAAGTRLATPGGEVAVEHLQAGDLVLTPDGRQQTIVWIGTRRVACHAHPKPEKINPVRVRAGAFGPSLPKRDLFLSPDHAVFADGVLIPVSALINGTSVVQERVHSVRYLHVELALHDVVLAEGLPVESFLDLGDHRQFGDGPGPTDLHPDFTALSWEAACAPLKLCGPEVDAVRGRLARHEAGLRAAA